MNYLVNKATDKSVEFKGLHAQYLIMFAIGFVGCIIVFFIMSIIGVPMIISLPLILTALSMVVWYSFTANKKYGKYGLMQKQARRNVPTFHISRKTTLQITNNR